MAPLSAYGAPSNSPLRDFKGGPRHEQNELFKNNDEQKLDVCNLSNRKTALISLDSSIDDLSDMNELRLTNSNQCQLASI